MFRVLFAIWLFVLDTAPAWSGAWLREQGSGFASATVTQRSSNGQWSSEFGYYADYGLTSNVTLGVDLNDNDTLSGHALVFVRLPVGQASRSYRLAVELTLGGSHYLNSWVLMQKVTLSYGRAFDSIWGPGWLAIDGAYEMRGLKSEPILKLDATIGLSDGKHLRPILQIETAKISGQPLFYTITPSLQIPLTRDTQLLIGAQHRVTTQRSLGLKVGVWHRF
ncbi:MAG: hypothetical protein COB16_10800 [Rhodobacteraceae bacterium]|nr:MAG: hypothetical protein COB16_10800 [Paracoccaceae bacterium]